MQIRVPLLRPPCCGMIVALLNAQIVVNGGFEGSFASDSSARIWSVSRSLRTCDEPPLYSVISGRRT